MAQETNNQYQVMSSAWKKNFNPSDSELNTLSPFLFCRFVSNDIIGCMVVNEINGYPDIPIKNVYNFIRSALPSNVKYIKFDKKEDLINKKELETLCNHFKCNMEIAERYYKMLPSDEIEKIMDKYDFDKNKTAKKKEKI